MHLPKQAEPVERTVATEERANPTGLEPQVECFCVQGKYVEYETWHCRIGKVIWDTLYPC